MLNVSARGDFRHDAAIGPVLFELAEDNVRQDLPLAVGGQAHDRRRGFIAAAFDSQDRYRIHKSSSLTLPAARHLLDTGRETLYSMGDFASTNTAGNMAERLRIGTRGSRLARLQTDLVRAALAAAHGWDTQNLDAATEVVIIQTSGDRVQNPEERDAGGKGIFTKEIEDALLRKRIDMAVHSTKDLLATLPSGLIIGSVLEREDPRDAFISPTFSSFNALKEGALIGTSSPRRRAQALQLRPDLKLTELRGNVETRLKKMRDQNMDATFLAAAGLKRAGLEREITEVMSTADMLPAGGQGALCVEVHEGNESVRELLAPIGHEQSRLAVTVERAFLQMLDGSCRTPIACLAKVNDEGLLTFRGQLLLPDGSEQEQIATDVQLDGDIFAQASTVGEAMGRELKARAGPRYFDDQE